MRSTLQVRGASLFLNGMRVGVSPGVAVTCAGGMRSTLLLLSTPCFRSRLLSSGKWGFGLCILGSRICPKCACMLLSSAPYSLFAFCCWRRGVFRCEQCGTAGKGPRSQPVSVLEMDFFFVLSSLNCQLLLYIIATVFKNWFYILQLFLLHTGFSGGFACNS